MFQIRVPRLVRIAFAPVLVAGVLVAAAPAMAVDYCVNTSCGGTAVGDLQTALGLAAISTSPDRIFLGTGTYTAAVSSGFSYNKVGDPVELIGSGLGTVVTGPAGMNGNVLRLYGGPGTSIHDLIVRFPANTTPGSYGLQTDGAARKVTVWEDPTQISGGSLVGVLLNGGSLEQSDVDLALENPTGVVLGDQGGTIEHSTVAARNGIYSGFGGTIRTTAVSGGAYGLVAARGTTRLSSSVVAVDGSSAHAVQALAYAGTSNTVDVDNVTLVGAAGKSSNGVEALNSSGPSESVHVTVRNTSMLDITKAFSASSSGTGAVDVTATYSDYNGALNSKSGNATITESNISNVGKAGVGDDYYYPLPGSPLLDAGDPATEQGEDAYGHPLVTDGNNDGIARRDIGAGEAPGPLPGAGAGVDTQPTAGEQPLSPLVDPAVALPPHAPDTQPPLVSGLRLSRTAFAVGRGTRLSYRLSERARVVVRIVRLRSGRTAGRLIRDAGAGANRLRFSGRIGRRALRPGRYRALVTATDAAGNTSKTRAVGFRVVSG